MFTVYAEKNAFEKIVVDDVAPNWFSIISNHEEVYLNISDEDLEEAEIDESSTIFQFIMQNAGRRPTASKEYFDSIYKEPSIIAEKPRSVLFLNHSTEEAAI